MSPERVAAVVIRWARFYTRDLPAAVARRRIDEITADLHDHVVHERAAGTGERRIALGIASRLLRGLAADIAWRRSHPWTRTSLRRSVLRVALGVGFLLSLPLVANQFTEGEGWRLGDFVLAGVLLTTIGVAFELAARRSGNRVLAVALGALGVVAGALGEADDAPGLVLLGLLLVAGGCAIGVRRARHSH
jgi:hypothetical protein